MSNGTANHHVDPEDMFSDTRMSFGDHIEELRTHLWRAIQGFVVAMIFSLFIGKYVVIFIKAPVEAQLERFYDRQARQRALAMLGPNDTPPVLARGIRGTILLDKNVLRRELGLPAKSEPVLGATVLAFERMLVEVDAADLIDRQLLKESNWVEVPTLISDPALGRGLQELVTGMPRKNLSTLNITEAFFVYFKVSMLTGFILASPWIFYQVWSFIAAGLYPHEKRLVNIYLPFSIALFLTGVLMCQFFVIPRAVEALLWFNEWLGLDPDLRLSEWLSFAIMMPLVFGISFQTPLVMLFLFTIGVADVELFRTKRRMAWFVMAIVAALITPTIDAFSMLFLWVPMGLLYELGIGLCILQGRAEAEEMEESDENELIEV